MSRCVLAPKRRTAHQVLYLEGEAANRVWMVKSGQVGLYRSTGGDESFGRLHSLCGPGQLVGMEALVARTYLDTAETMTEVTLCGTTRDHFDIWLGPAGTPSRTTLELTLSQRMHESIPAVAVEGSAVQRVAAWLWERHEEPWAKLPHRLIANHLGMRQETLSRVLRQLVETGAIRSSRGPIQVASKPILEALGER